MHVAFIINISYLYAGFVRVLLAINLEKNSQIISQTWCYSIALDLGLKSSTNYMDIKIRFVLFGELYNFHLIAAPMNERHTGELMYALLVKVR